MLSPRFSEIIAFVFLCVVAFARWSSQLGYPHINPDEAVYVSAANLVREDRSPYEEKFFFYPPPFAVMGAWAVEELGEQEYVYVLRGLNLLGVCLTVWLSFRLTGWRRSWRGAGAVLVATGSQTVSVGVVAGNISGLVIGLSLAALLCWRDRPVVAGLLLAVSLAVKPLAVLIPILLVAHRPPDPGRGKFVAAIVTVVATGLLFLPWLARLPEFFANARGFADHPRNFSLQHLAWCFSVDLPEKVVFVVVLAAAVLWVRHRELDATLLLAVASAATLLALPIVWIYTLLLVLPLQCLAAARVARPGALSALVILAITSIFLAHGAGAITQAPLWAQGCVIAIPILSPLFLVGYISRRLPV